MRNIFTIRGWCFILFMLVVAMGICFCGCATLEGLLTEVQEITTTGEANPEIHATFDYVSDFVKNPWDSVTAVGIGYALALLRRWYKKKQGSQST